MDSHKLLKDNLFDGGDIMPSPMRKQRLIKKEKIAILSSCLPRECGIASFSANLGKALAESKRVSSVAYVAMNNGINYRYSLAVIYQIEQENLEDYFRAAIMLNASDIDVVYLQHEFGLFGGPDGNYVRVLLKHIQKPVITTLHNLPQNPSFGQREVIKDVINLSSATVVMNSLAIDMLADAHNVLTTKVNFIPLGVNLKEYENPSHYIKKSKMEGQHGWDVVAEKYNDIFSSVRNPREILGDIKVKAFV